MPDLSEYEQLRLANIARNEQALAKLQLPKIESTKKRPNTKRNREPAMRASERKSARLASAATRKPVIEYGTSRDAEQDSDYDGEAELDEGDEDEGLGVRSGTRETKPKASRNQRRKPVVQSSQDTKALEVQSAAVSDDGNAVLIVEMAKTGRSKCRGCLEPIPQGCPRVGQHAWIMGRNSVVWSHPKCCINRLIVAREPSGRSKCKVTGQALQKGQPKIGFRAHTATAWVGVERAASVIAPVLLVMPETDRQATTDALCGGPPKIDGFVSLTAPEQKLVQAALSHLMATSKSSSAMARDKSGATPGTPPQTNKMMSGRVAWKFGGATCFGDLLPNRETVTHCYARTHKGNVKTLTKGKSYWWLLR